MSFPEPVIGMAVEPKTFADIDKLQAALARLSDEDPTFDVKTSEETGQIIIRGMGELHIEILLDRLRREYKIECNQGNPMVAYKEAFKGSIIHTETYENILAGKNRFAQISVEVGPADEDEKGLVFINDLVDKNVPGEYVNAVKKGFLSSISNGILAGYPLENIKVVLKDIEYHIDDSDELAFEVVSKFAFRAAAEGWLYVAGANNGC